MGHVLACIGKARVDAKSGRCGLKAALPRFHISHRMSDLSHSSASLLFSHLIPSQLAHPSKCAHPARNTVCSSVPVGKDTPTFLPVRRRAKSTPTRFRSVRSPRVCQEMVRTGPWETSATKRQSCKPREGAGAGLPFRPSGDGCAGSRDGTEGAATPSHRRLRGSGIATHR